MHSLAQHLQSQGRGNDTVLVHMTPREVGGLQALAQSAGGTLTRNPTTGLPEAGFLEDILPTIAGVAGGALGLDPWMTAAGVGAITGLTTGNLEKGLMAGLGAYGGAALGRTINPSGMEGLGLKAAMQPPPPGLTTINPTAGVPSTPNLPMDETGAFTEGFAPTSARQIQAATIASPTISLDSAAFRAPQLEEPGFFDRFSANAAAGLPSGLTGIAPYAAGLGLAMPFLGSSNSGLGAITPQEPKKLGPPKMWNRTVRYPSNPRSSAEFMYFTPSNPYTPGYAEGGDVQAKPRNAPAIALPPGYTAQPPAARYSTEQLFNFPRATNIPALVKAAATPEAAALQKEYPTATAAQLAEYNRGLQEGGDPAAMRSLMQAYSPAASVKALQPWSPEYKGDTYRDSHPVDAFGNPIGWELPKQPAPTVDANGVPAGWDPRDWENMKNTNLGNPDPEYIINNPWAYGTTSLGVGDFLVSPSSQFSSNAQFGRAAPAMDAAIADQKVEAQRQAALSANRADNTAENYVMYGTPDAPIDPNRNVAPWSSASPSASTFGSILNSVMAAAPRNLSTPAPSGDRTNWTTGNYLNAGQSLLGLIPGLGTGTSLGLGALRWLGEKAFNIDPSYTNAPAGANWLERMAAGRGILPSVLDSAYGVVTGKAAGGVNLEDGSFVVDARTVSELGNGSSSAGQELLARMGGRPIKGPGDGVSDSIRANIGGKQEARVARDEVKFSPEAVKRIGGGDPKKGSDRLYDMMKKAEKARKTASRGKDTGLRALVGAK